MAAAQPSGAGDRLQPASRAGRVAPPDTLPGDVDRRAHDGSAPPGETAAKLRAATELLESVARDRGLLGSLSIEERTRLLTAAADVFNPDVVQRRRFTKAQAQAGEGREASAPTSPCSPTRASACCARGPCSRRRTSTRRRASSRTTGTATSARRSRSSTATSASSPTASSIPSTTSSAHRAPRSTSRSGRRPPTSRAAWRC